jgi:ATP-dependent DNA helicase RecG
MSPTELNTLLLARSESEHVEFKEAKNRYDFEELVAYCVALSNECGGKMVMGVTDALPRKVVGTQAFDVPERTVAGIYERIQIKVGWEEIAHPDGRVLVFDVPSRPQGQPIHYGGRYFMRAGSSLVPMSPDQLRRIFDEGQVEFVEQPARRDSSEEDVMRLLDVQSYFDLKKRPFPSTRKEALDTLAQKGFVQTAGANYTVTNLGALLFAKRLDDFAHLARKAVRVIVYEGISKARVKGGKDITDPKGYAAGFEALVDFIHNESASEDMSASLRQTTHAYPKKAVREILGNALVHQDLTERGTSVTVEIFDDRIEVSNPGLPILPVDRFIDENQSRNEKFADALRQLGICEERGHGMDAVVTAIESAQMPAYECRLASHHTTVILSRFKPLKDMSPDERAHAVYQHCCLRFVNNQPTGNESMRERFKIEKKNAAIASRLLAEAVAAKKIRPVDAAAANKLMRYVPYWA